MAPELFWLALFVASWYCMLAKEHPLSPEQIARFLDSVRAYPPMKTIGYTVVGWVFQFSFVNKWWVQVPCWLVYACNAAFYDGRRTRDQFSVAVLSAFVRVLFWAVLHNTPASWFLCTIATSALTMFIVYALKETHT